MCYTGPLNRKIALWHWTGRSYQTEWPDVFLPVPMRSSWDPSRRIKRTRKSKPDTPARRRDYFQLFSIDFNCFHSQSATFATINSERKMWGNKDFGAEETWTEDHSLKNLRSIHLGYLLVDECRWKIIDAMLVTATDYLHQHCACKRLSRDARRRSFRFVLERQFSSERANLPGIRLLHEVYKVYLHSHG